MPFQITGELKQTTKNKNKTKKQKKKKKKKEKKVKTGQIPGYLIKFRNMKVTVIPIIIFGAHGTILKNLEKKLGALEIKGRIKTIQTTALLKSTRILKRTQGS